MNITHVVENLNRGGLERVVIELAKAQRAAGHEVQVVCLYDRGGLAGELDAAGIPVRAVEKRQGIDLRALLRLRRAIGRHRTQVLHSHNSIPHYYAVFATVGMRFRRVVNTRHGMGDINPSSRREWLFRQSMRRTDVAATVCEAARTRLAEISAAPRDKLRAVPNGIHVERFRQADAGSRARLVAGLGLQDGTHLVGFVGRLNWAKDLATLVRAFAIVATQRDDVALVLVGDGEEREALAGQIAQAGLGDRVRLLGDRSDVPDLLSGFDLFAMSSISEGYSIALLEACASGLPVVATDVGGNREIVHDGSHGLLVPARDPDALAAAIVSLIADPVRRTAMAGAARRWALAEATFPAMAARYQSLYADGLAPADLGS
ncbi:MAG: glycosyltransferase [Xanthomonadales bacterium]|nr:glycosyltransferase [Xanthomonadales bacterium]